MKVVIDDLTSAQDILIIRVILRKGLNVNEISLAEHAKIYDKYMVDTSKYSKPVRLYLDVDNVVIPQPHNEEEANRYRQDAVEVEVFKQRGWEVVGKESGLIWWNKPVIARLAALSHSPDVDVVWLTSWRENAPYVLDDLLGIKSLGFLPWQHKMADYAQSFKGVAIEEDQQDYPSKFVWLDDLANISWDGLPYFTREEWDTNETIDTISPSDYLSIVVDKYAGLTMENMDTVESWVADNRMGLPKK